MDLAPLIAGVVTDVVAHMAFHAVLNTTLPGIGLLVSGVLMFWRSGKIKGNTRKVIAEALAAELPKMRLTYHEELRNKVTGAFNAVAKDINRSVEDQISQLDASMRDIIEQKKQEEFNAEQRKTELQDAAAEFHNSAQALIAKLAV